MKSQTWELRVLVDVLAIYTRSRCDSESYILTTSVGTRQKNTVSVKSSIRIVTTPKQYYDSKEMFQSKPKRTLARIVFL